MYEVITYYKFISLVNPPKFCADQRRKCQELDLLGRVYVSREGINGTLAGKAVDIKAYEQFLNELPGFNDVEFKTHESVTQVFADLRVKLREEIVALKADQELDAQTETGKFLNPKEWREVLDTQQNYVLIDVRNEYESKIGHFEGAICPDVENFYDFPEWLDQEEGKLDKNKKVLMYCTGGIRCEKFSVLMKKKGFKDVNQLQGGILKYAQEEAGAHFKGKCFVFDDRLVVFVNKDEKEPLSRCKITGAPCDQYINCANMDCNKLFICSREGAIKMKGCCSEECMNSTNIRPFNLEELYIPFRRWYKYFDESDKSARKLKPKYA